MGNCLSVKPDGDANPKVRERDDLGETPWNDSNARLTVKSERGSLEPEDELRIEDLLQPDETEEQQASGEESTAEVSFMTSEESSNQEEVSFVSTDEPTRVKEIKQKFRDVESIKVGGVEDSGIEQIGSLIQEFEKVTANANSKRLKGTAAPLQEMGVSKMQSVKNFSDTASIFKRNEGPLVVRPEVPEAKWREEIPENRPDISELAKKFSSTRPKSVKRSKVESNFSKQKFVLLTGRFAGSQSDSDSSLLSAISDDGSSFALDDNRTEGEFIKPNPVPAEQPEQPQLTV